MDVTNPFERKPLPSPGEEYAKMARKLASFVQYLGGPKLNEDALAVVITDLFTWLKR